MQKKRLLIVGGVAGGASCAARARRLSEDVEIVIFERGPYVSFANCGLPYYVGNVIKKEDDLLVASPKLFKDRFNIDVRTLHNVRSIHRESREIEVENLETGITSRERYDALVLSPGSAPLRPDINGINIPGIFTLWTIPEMHDILNWINEKSVKHAAVIGGGFIGLEMTENLHRRDIHVSIIEMQNHIIPVLDPEMAAFLQKHLISKGIGLHLGSPVSGFEQDSDEKISVKLASGETVLTDVVILSMGVQPRIELAQYAGLTIGDLGGILVDEKMRTSDENIWAVGDAVEVKDVITHMQTRVPLAGPANRQGRIAADVIMGNDSYPPSYRGSQGTSVCGVMDMTVASTGLTENAIKRINGNNNLLQYEKIYLHPNNHADYYPGAKTITMKLIFSKQDGRILGAQALGREGVEKRIDVIAMAIQKNGTVFDLEEAELCYAPQYGSAKDPVNLAGMIAANILRGYSSVTHWKSLIESNVFVLDVRTRREFKKSHLENTVNIPLDQLRRRIKELPQDREIWTHCVVGQRSYIAERILKQNGFRVRNLSGGNIMHEAFKDS